MDIPTQSETKLDVIVKKKTFNVKKERKIQAKTNCLNPSSMPCSVKTGNTTKVILK